MFSPYHRLNSCLKLEKWFDNHIDSGVISADVIAGHNRYHYALLHKLKSAKVHLENLIDILTNTDASTVLPNSEEFLQKVNMSLDCFFYCCGSALDILAREVLIYFNIPMTGNVYFHTAHNQLQRTKPGDTILSKLVGPSWKDEFSNYRNALTHEVLIGGNFSIQFIANGRTHQKTIVFPLPDDPRAESQNRTSKRNDDALEYCKQTFTRLLSLINQIYGDIELRARTANSLPL
jgi:hypothetical protein